MNYKLSNISYQLSILLVAIFFVSPLRAQVVIGNNVATPRPFSLLELDKTYHTGGLRLPQLTIEQRAALNLASDAGAAKGLVIYNISTNCVEFWDGNQWESLCDGSGSIYLTDESNARISRNIEDPFLNGSETRSYTSHDAGCTTGTSFTVTVRLGGDYTHTGTPDATGKFTLKMDDNPSANPRLAILRVTDGCGYQDFLISQEGKACIAPSVQAVSDFNQTITQGSTATMEVVADTGTEPLTYQWYWWTSDNVSSALPVGGAQDNIFSTTLSTAGTYYFWCKISNTCGTATSATFTVTVSCLPAQPSEIIGKPFPHLGATGVTYSVIQVPGVSYKWTLPTDWTQTAGGNSNSITVTIGTGSGKVSVTPSNSCGDGLRQTLDVKVIKPCGAYIATGVWKEFMCWNLGANEDADPFAPSADLNGDYYQWGYQYPSAVRDVIIGTPTSAGDKIYPLDRAWNNASPTPGFYGNNVADAVTTDKSLTDPCPAGFRVPNQDEWMGVMDASLNLRTNNPATWSDAVGSWWSGSMFGDSLFLPTAGYHYYDTGVFAVRGTNGFYWSSTVSSTTPYMFFFTASTQSVTYSSPYNSANGLSIRCIKDVDEISGPKYISIPRTTVPQTFSVSVPGATGYAWEVPTGWTIASNDGAGTITLFPGTIVEDGGTISVTVSLSGSGSKTFTKAIKACRAMTADGVFSNFMCHNLGADETAEPFTPSQDLNGDYYQWGYKYPSAHRDDPVLGTPTTADGSSYGASWSATTNFSAYYGDNTTTSSVEKSTSDPCPTGYRIPNRAEWSGVINITQADLNPRTDNPNAASWTEGVGNWVGSNFGGALFLPAAGYRSGGNGTLYTRGTVGYYWCSTLDHTNGVNNFPSTAYFANGQLIMNNYNGVVGNSVRCIADPQVEITGPKYISIPRTTVPQTYSVDAVPGATYNWHLPTGWTIASNDGAGTITLFPGTIVEDGGTISVTVSLSGSGSKTFTKAIKACRAMTADGVWSNFMCHNMGADEAAEPFTPSQDINGSYYQWGSKDPVATVDTDPGAISGYPGVPWTWYGDGTTSATQTTKNESTDPCPAGYRVPNLSEWTGVMNTGLNGKTNYPIGETWSTTSGGWYGAKFGDALFLPAAGDRSNTNGTLSARGTGGYYWSSTLYSDNPTSVAYHAGFVSSIPDVSFNNRAYGSSVRCIADPTVIEIAGPKYISIPRTTVPQTFSVDVPGATGYAWEVPTGWTIASDDGNGTITLFPGTAIEDGGTISVVVTTSSGSKTFTKEIKACGAMTTAGGFKNFMCHNLGADETKQMSEEMAYGSTTGNEDAIVSGDLFQWGRVADGHQKRDLNTTTDVVLGPLSGSALDAAGQAAGSNIGKFVKVSGVTDDWRSPSLDVLWNKGTEDTPERGDGDPCPAGWRVPTEKEWTNIFNGAQSNIGSIPAGGQLMTSGNYWKWNSSGSIGWMVYSGGDASGDVTLFLPANGFRNNNNLSLVGSSTLGNYWSSTTNGTNVYSTQFNNTAIQLYGSTLDARSFGRSVRCIADENSAVEITGPKYISIPRTTVPQTYSISIPGATGYSWSVPTTDGWEIKTGQGSNTISIFPATTVQLGGTISVEVTMGDGSKLTVTKEIKACGAKSYDDVWNNFMCHNLGADETAEPFTPSPDLNGDYWQWGYKYPSATYDAINGDVIKGTPTTAGGSDYGPLMITLNSTAGDWSSGSNNPCPAGYRIPTRAEWEGAVWTTVQHPFGLNLKVNLGDWVPDPGSPTAWSGSMFGDALFLPAAGSTFDQYAAIGPVLNRGSQANYWSTTKNTDHAWGASYWAYFAYGRGTDMGAPRNENYASVRCIADEPVSSCTTAPAQPGAITSSTGTGVVKDGVSVDYSIPSVPGVDNYTLKIWTVPSGWKINGINYSSTTTTATTITVTPVIDWTADGTVVTVIAKNACGISEPSVLAVSPCGAKVSSSELRAFMCYNLGATKNGDPFTPSPDLNGDYYQWGKIDPVATASTPPGPMTMPPLPSVSKKTL